MESTTIFIVILTIGCMTGNVFYNVWLVKSNPWIKSSDRPFVTIWKACTAMYLPIVLIILLGGYATEFLLSEGYSSIWVENIYSAVMVIWALVTTFIPMVIGPNEVLRNIHESPSVN